MKMGMLLLALLLSPLAQANDTEIKELRTALAKRMPMISNSASIKATPIKGLYEVMSGAQIMYMTKDARYIVDGDLYDMKSRQNLTESARGSIRLKTLKQLGEENMLVYTPEGKVKHTITVFTDIYCPYCRRLHEEMNEYMSNGVKVRYIFTPFKGQRSVDTSVAVWCAKDRNRAMDRAKAGEEIEKKTCANPISQHQAVSQNLGIRGTPAIMLENGQLLPGYVPAEKLIQQIDAQ